MKDHRRNLAVGIIIGLCITLLPLQGTGKRKRKKAQAKRIERKVKKQPARLSYKNYIWIEGENAVSTNFAKEKTYNFFCSGKYALQLSRESDPPSKRGYFATYTFYAPKSKKYDFWMGCTPPGSKFAGKTGYASPVEWRIDKGAFAKASSENVRVRSYYAPGSFYWVKISTAGIKAGKHTLTLRVNQKRSSGWDYYFYVDSIVFIPTYSKYLNPIMTFPRAAPEDFSVKGRGITFTKASVYKRDVTNRQSLFTLVQIYTWLFEYNKSIDLLRGYLKRHKKDIEMRILLASSLAWADRVNDAIKEYKTITRIDKKNITARKLMAVLAGWNNRYDEAIRNYQEIIKIDPKNVDAYISLATQLTWSGNEKKAIGIFQKAEAIAPNNIQVLYTLGDNYYWAGRTVMALQKYRKIISLDEKQIKAYKKIARVYLDLGKKRSADSILKDAALIQTTYPELASISLDIEGEREKEARATIDEYKLALKKNPENIESRKNLIDTYRWNKMDDDAAEEYSILLNMKEFKKLDSMDRKLSSLEMETIKFRLARVKIRELLSKISEIRDRYTNAAEDIKRGKDVRGLSTTAITRDRTTLAEYEKMVTLYEKALSHFSDVMNLHSNEVQSFLAQKEALAWRPDRWSLKKQLKIAMKKSPDDYRPHKVMAVYRVLFGSKGSAADSLRRVQRKSPKHAEPLYIYTLAGAGRTPEAHRFLTDAKNNRRLSVDMRRKLASITAFLASFQKRLRLTGLQPVKNKRQEIQALAGLAKKTDARLRELLKEQKEKISDADGIIDLMFKKALLELENENVPIYKEIAEYHLSREKMYTARHFYQSILNVQPMNVETNFKMGNLKAAAGYWASAMNNYQTAINNQPDHVHARQNLYDLQKEYSPSLSDNFNFFTDTYGGKKISARYSNKFTAEVPLNGWFTLTGGYDFVQLSDKGGVANGGQSYLPSKGFYMSHTGHADLKFTIVPINAALSASVIGSYYTGAINFKSVDASLLTSNDQALILNSFMMIKLSDSNFSYMTLNYAGSLEFSPYIRGIRIRAGYAKKDITDTTQARSERISARTLSAALDLNLEEYNFPLSKRIFLNDSLDYSLYSDNNVKIATYNELTFRVLRFPLQGIYLDLSGVVNYEQSQFTEYREKYATYSPTNLSYWAPKGDLGLSGNIKFKHTIDNFLRGSFTYAPYFKYTYEFLNQYTVFFFDSSSPLPCKPVRENFHQTGFTAGIELRQRWDRIELFLAYSYSTAKAIERTSGNYNTENWVRKPYESHEATFGIKGRFFKIYQPKGMGKEPVVLATASPEMITPDNDGKDDYSTITLTAFDEKGIRDWKLEIYNDKGRLLRSISRGGTPPATVRWDGTDKSFNPLPQGSYTYQLVITNTEKQRSVSKKGQIFVSRKARAVTLETSYKEFSPNGDGSMDTMSFSINATDKEQVRAWSLRVLRGRGGVIRTISGTEFLPFDVEWDGKNARGNTVPDGIYNAKIRITYTDNTRIESPLAPVRVLTKTALTIRAKEKEIDPKKGALTLIPRSGVKQVQSWTVRVTSPDGRLLKLKKGSGTLPKKITLSYKNKDKTLISYNMALTILMEIKDAAGNRARSNALTLWSGFLVKSVRGKRVIVLFSQELLNRGKSAAFQKTADPVIAKLVDFLRRTRPAEIRVRAFTSDEGSESSNRALAQRRARGLAGRIKKKLKNIKITSQGIGETSPYFRGKSSNLDVRYEIEIQ